MSALALAHLHQKFKVNAECPTLNEQLEGKFILRYRQIEEEWGRFIIRSFIGGRLGTRAARILNNNFEIESAVDGSITVSYIIS